MQNNNNPYAQASNAYGQSSSHAPTDQRSLEAQLLLKAAQKLEQLQLSLKNGITPSLEQVDDILEYNRKLWTVFASETANEENPLPQDIKNNIASLAVFIFKRTVSIQSETTAEKFDVLIEINRQIASGLMKQAENAETAAPATETPPSQENTLSDTMA